MTNNIPAPLELYTTNVQPEWLDYNNHMTEGFYAVAFANASDEFIDYVGLDAGYRSRTNCTVYTAESHISYLHELKLGSPLRFTTQLLGHDAKRMHIFHCMFHAKDGFKAAVFETMMLHVDQTKDRVVPMPLEVLAKFAAVQISHQALPMPEKAGRRISMNRQ
jgi:acyl-CoA thioesterase FadM